MICCPKPIVTCIFACFALIFSSCSTYLVSPLDTGSNPYIPLPVKKRDSTAITHRYAGIHISPGLNVNDNGEGGFFNYGTLRFVQSHAFGGFRMGYGANVLFGSYNTGPGDAFSGDPQEAYRATDGGNLFFGAAGVNAKISYALPYKSGRGEWRILGIEGAAHREFGKFLPFRQHYPGNSDDYIERRDWTYTAGIFTEFMSVKKTGKQFGFKLGLSMETLPKLFYAFDPYRDDDATVVKDPPAIPHYLNFAFVFGKNNVLGFVQPNIGTATFNVQGGVLVKLP